MCRDHSQSYISHAVENFVIGNVAGAIKLDSGICHSSFGELFHQRSRLPSRHEHEDGVGRGVASALKEGCEIRVLQWNAHGLDDLSAGADKAFPKRVLGIMTRSKIRDHGDDLLGT